MPPFANHEPLTDAELDHLGRFLKNCNGGMAMNIEEPPQFLDVGDQTEKESFQIPRSASTQFL
jgi:hypothetical protein